MAQLPVLLRPRYAIRRKAIRSGVFGPSLAWRSVAIFILFWNVIKKFFGRDVEALGTRTIGMGHVITVATSVPLTRRQAKRAGVTKASLETAARAELEAAQQAS